MKKYVLIFALFLGVNAIAQKELNAYKYIVIPTRFDFQKEANEYGVNLLLKYKFQQLGFEAYLDTDDLPQVLRVNTCMYAYPVLHTEVTMFKTIISVELLNCSKKSLYHSQKGESRAKNIKTSYNEALRKSLKSFGDYKLEYVPVKDEIIANDKNELVKTELTKEKNVTSVKTLNQGEFSYKNTTYLLLKKGLMYFEVQNVKTKSIVGKIIQSSFKKDVFHVKFNNKKGFCYYGDNGNLIMEFMSLDNSVEMISLPKVN